METGIEEVLCKVISTGVEMRNWQKEYFKTRSRDTLIKAKELEKRFDDSTKALKEIRIGNFKIREIMKTILTTAILVLAMTIASGQDINKGILDYTDEVIGHEVGKGHCRHLIMEALIATNSCIYLDSMVSSNNVIAGDIVCFDGIVDSNGVIGEKETIWGVKPLMWMIDNHVAIIYKVLGDGKYIIAEQAKGEPVTLREMDTRKIMYGYYTYLKVITCKGRIGKNRNVNKLRPKLYWKPIAHIREPQKAG